MDLPGDRALKEEEEHNLTTDMRYVLISGLLCEDDYPLVVWLLVSLVVAHCSGAVHLRRCSYTEHLSLLLLASVSSLTLVSLVKPIC